MDAMVLVGGTPQLAEVVKVNAKTIMVRLKDGSIVTRHRVKHGAGIILGS